MKAISLWQPWASLWVGGPKIHETRHWYTPVRGWIAVHAAKRREKIDQFDALSIVCDRAFGDCWRSDLPYGAIIGMVEIEDVYSTWKNGESQHEDEDDLICGDFSPGRYVWRRGSFVKFTTPVPFAGKQSWFDVPTSIAIAP